MRNRSEWILRPTPAVAPADLRATDTGTSRFRQRFSSRFASDYFRDSTFRLTLSSIGIGTYLGGSDDADDARYEASVAHAIESGINVIDTAINYRAQRSERAVGAAVQRVLAAGLATRQELVICSKAGYLPLNGAPPATREEYQDYVRREFLDSEILRPEEIVGGGHSLAPRFLRYCLAKSRQNLGVRTIDVYYLHNPEQQLGSVDWHELRARLRAAFVVLEEAVTRGEISVYGVATWEGLRLPPGAKCHLSLEALVEIAREVSGDAHHFRAAQLPLNLGMAEAVRTPSQPIGGRLVSAIEAAGELGITIITSATLMQAKLASGLPDAVRAAFPDCETDAQRAIAFARTVAGVTSALIGMKRVAHVEANLRLAEL